jgi:SAM-dependent methyltransferase
MASTQEFSSAAYWEDRYRQGGTSGTGSRGRLARFKAETINRFIAANDIRSVIDLGCGDTAQLALLELPADYVGVDVSASALARCAARFPGRRFIMPEDLATVVPAELTLSLDVIYHLIEDAIFAAAMRTLFSWATRFVVIYASNLNADWSSAHVRHRRFTDHVAATEPGWRLLAHLPNPCPFDPAAPDETSFADFFIYGRRGAACAIVVPG